MSQMNSIVSRALEFRPSTNLCFATTAAGVMGRASSVFCVAAPSWSQTIVFIIASSELANSCVYNHLQAACSSVEDGGFNIQPHSELTLLSDLSTFFNA